MQKRDPTKRGQFKDKKKDTGIAKKVDVKVCKRDDLF